MKILGVDLAWGTTGWCFYDDESEEIICTGYFSFSTGKKGVQKVAFVAPRIHEAIQTLCYRHEPDVVVFEYTDWKQNLTKPSAGQTWRSMYQRERNVLRALGQARATAVLACKEAKCRIDEIGANEAKEYLSGGTGGLKKAIVARHLTGIFPSLEFLEDSGENGPFVYDSQQGRKLTHDETDAICISYAYGSKERFNRLVELA